jgi:hypothetical protein
LGFIASETRGPLDAATFARFLKANEGNNRVTERRDVLERIYVVCRIITDAAPES